jgi:hypothetical protein
MSPSKQSRDESQPSKIATSLGQIAVKTVHVKETTHHRSLIVCGGQGTDSPTELLSMWRWWRHRLELLPNASKPSR